MVHPVQKMGRIACFTQLQEKKLNIICRAYCTFASVGLFAPCFRWFVAHLCFSGFCCLPLLPRVCCLPLLPRVCCLPLPQWGCCTTASVGFVAYLCFCGFSTHLCWPPLVQNDMNSTSIRLVLLW